MPSKRKQMHEVKIEECDSLRLAHIATRSLGKSKFVVNKRSCTSICPDETSDPNHLGGTKRQKIGMHGGKSVSTQEKKGPQCSTCCGVCSCICSRENRNARTAWTSSTCIHGRQKSKCKDCGGVGICIHGRRKSECKECGGVSICIHGRLKSRCKECLSRPVKQA